MKMGDMPKKMDAPAGPGEEYRSLLSRLQIVNDDLKYLVNGAEEIEARLLPVDDSPVAKTPDAPPTLMHLVTDLEAAVQRLNRALTAIKREFTT